MYVLTHVRAYIRVGEVISETARWLALATYIEGPSPAVPIFLMVIRTRQEYLETSCAKQTTQEPL